MSSFSSKTVNSSSGACAPQAASIQNQENRVPNILTNKREIQTLQEGASSGGLLRTLSQTVRGFGREILNQVSNPLNVQPVAVQAKQTNLISINTNSHPELIKQSKTIVVTKQSIRNVQTAAPSQPLRKLALNANSISECIDSSQDGFKSSKLALHERILNSSQDTTTCSDGSRFLQHRPQTTGSIRLKNLRVEDKLARLKEFELYKNQYYNIPREQFIAIDQADYQDPQAVAEHAAECQKHMQNTEQLTQPLVNCIATQKDLTNKMRQILVDWLVEVHLKFKLLPETLFLTVNLIDRFTFLKQVKRNDYQLLGVTAMLIACKYEEIYAPEIRDFVYMTDKAYTKEQILLMERDILLSLDFNITSPSLYRFIERYIKLSASDDLIMNFSRYIIELTLIETSMYKWKTSQIAASAVYVARKVLKRQHPWSEFMREQTSYDEKMVRSCAKDLCIILYNASKLPEYKSILKKYSMPRFMEVSKICCVPDQKQSPVNSQVPKPDQPE